jgi:hypothetical protein
MEFCRRWVGWLSLVAGAVSISSNAVLGQSAGAGWSLDRCSAAPTLPVGLFHHRSAECLDAAAQIPLGDLPPRMRDNVNVVLEKPTLFTHGPKEAFTCSPSMYQWFLDHPDQAVRVWRRLGARCMDIENRGQGIFAWTDGQGSDVRWWTIYRNPQMRIWYAEGNAKAPGILPLIPVRVVVVLHHVEGRNASGQPMMQHHADLFVQTDSRTASLVARLMGPSVPRMAEQAAGQMEMFFSALAWYLDQHPAKAENVLLGILPADAPEWRTIRRRTAAPAAMDSAISPDERDSGK